MTYQDCIDFIRTLLDTDHEDYYADKDIINAVREAQSVIVNTLHISEDERGLRPLYDVSHYKNGITSYIPLTDGTEVDGKCKYPKGLVINIGDVNYFAQYLPYSKYVTIPTRTGLYLQNDTDHYPSSLYWSYKHNTTATAIKMVVFFTADSSKPSSAELAYIREPLLFSQTQPIELPDEYHHVICLLAAEVLNAIDVGELDRSDGIDIRSGYKNTFNQLGVI